MSILKISFITSLLIMSLCVQSAKASISWEEEGHKVEVTLENAREAKSPIFGYVSDMLDKNNLCYSGQDYEAIDIIIAGFNKNGIETCDSYILVRGTTITVGPCFHDDVPNDIYQLEITACK